MPEVVNSLHLWPRSKAWMHRCPWCWTPAEESPDAASAQASLPKGRQRRQNNFMNMNNDNHVLTAVGQQRQGEQSSPDHLWRVLIFKKYIYILQLETNRVRLSRSEKNGRSPFRRLLFSPRCVRDALWTHSGATNKNIIKNPPPQVLVLQGAESSAATVLFPSLHRRGNAVAPAFVERREVTSARD